MEQSLRDNGCGVYYNVMAYSGATASTSMYNYTASGTKETGCFDTINLYEYAIMHKNEAYRFKQGSVRFNMLLQEG